MLEEPPIERAALLACLQHHYRLETSDLIFLPLGADPDTAVYRVATSDNRRFFLKLRSGGFDEASVAVPKFLSDAGMKYAIPPLTTRHGHLWASLPPFNIILYPYIQGHDAYTAKLTDAQWVEFGSALRAFHTARIPASLTRSTPREGFSPRWRDSLCSYLARFGSETFEEPTAARLAAFLSGKSRQILSMVSRTEELARTLKRQPLHYILCHGDIHLWNLLVADDGALYIVDWDTLMFAPPERDLMFIGSGLADSGRTPEQEYALFYQGYGRTDVNWRTIAYYRYARIIEDIAVYCNQVFLSRDSGQDRQVALTAVMSNFRPGGTVQRAEEADRAPN